MSLKVLSVYENQTVATESFISDAIAYITGSLYGLLSPKDAKRIIGEALAPKNHADKKKAIEALLNQTVFNKTWCEKSIKNKKTTHTSKFAYIDAKAVGNPQKLLQCMNGPMLDGAKDAIDKLKDNIKLRQELCKVLDKISDPEEADELWEKNKNKLIKNQAAEYLKRGSKKFSCTSSAVDMRWPLMFYPKSKNHEFCGSVQNDGAAAFEALATSNAHEWGLVVLKLLDLVEISKKLYTENYIPYWDDASVEYDDLRYGDEIFDYIYTGQTNYAYDPALALSNAAYALVNDLMTAILVK